MFNELKAIAYAVCQISLAVAGSVADQIMTEASESSEHLEAVEMEQLAFLAIMHLDISPNEEPYILHAEQFHE